MATFAANYRKMFMTMNEDKQMAVIAEQENRTDNTPVSMLDFIPQMSGSKGFVVNINNRWLNGKEGAITDARGDNHYRFYLMRNSDIVYKKPEDNPIVAVGIVAYWLHHRENKDRFATWDGRTQIYKQTILEQFVAYTDIQFLQFRDKREQRADSWRCDIKAEFYTDYIIPHVKQQNEISVALLDYITPNDCQFVQSLMQEYVLYLEMKKTEYGKNTDLKISIPYTKYDEQAETLTMAEKVLDLGKIVDEKAKAAFDKYKEENEAADEDIDEIFSGIYGKDLVDQVNKEMKETDNQSDISELPTRTVPNVISKHVSTSEENWDDSFDYIFDERVKPKEIKKAIAAVTSEKIHQGRRFYYVAWRVLKSIRWILGKSMGSDYMQWVNLHFKCGWEKQNKKKRYLFNLEGKAKKLEDSAPSEWKDDTLYSDLGKHYRLLAISFKNAFTQTMINGLAIDDSDSFEKLKDRTEFLTGGIQVFDKYHAPEEAYINNGK